MLKKVTPIRLFLLGLVAIPSAFAVVKASAHFDIFIPPILVGDVDRGYVRTELYRGASVPDEIVVAATPGNCENNLDLEIAWDEGENEVRVRLRGQNALDPHPTITRTEGVDFFPNPWWPEAKDVVDGRYLLWIIHVVGVTEFYYSGETLELLGSEYDFESPPAGAIPIHVPGFVAVPTDFIEVQPDGDVDFTHVFEYDGLKRGDLPDYAHFFASFVPDTLCRANPYDYTQTSSRPYASATLPASEAIPFSEYLRNGLIFDITVEPAEYASFPPISTNVATYSQALTVPGGIPEGWTNDLEAVFANLAPPIRPWEPAGSCENWFKPVRDRDFNVCGPQGGAQ
jgi:hypothetical protein